MATLPPGTEVSIRIEALRRLNFPPPQGSVLVVAVHEGALLAPGSPHTQLIGLRHGDVIWAGALGEHLLTVESEGGGDPRQLLGDAMGTGPRLWDVVWPLELVADSRRGRLSTVYQGERPWVVIGLVSGGDLLAAPLNEAANPKRFTPILAQEDVLMPGSSKASQLELAHVWSLPQSLAAVGSVAPEARDRILEALRSYF
ncbi:MAG: hypothetical protein OEO79_13215 [Gemmatimonadota bacterium]|nr:hypothetical protein [Gemmatimonadota bacterium]MDH3421954.1 hypothetical protein [Gemmatimonadota bacterium]